MSDDSLIRETRPLAGLRFLPREKTILTLAFLAFFQPAQYAIPSTLYLFWRGYALVVSVGAVILFLRNCRISLRWVAFCGFFALCLLFTSYLYETSISLIWILSQFLKAVGLVSLFEMSLVRDKGDTLFSFAVAGSIMCFLHFGSYVIYSDVVGGMRSGFIQTELGKTTATDGNWFLLTYDNDSLFYILPVLVVLWIYGIKYSRRAYLPLVALTLCTLYMYVRESAATVTTALFIFLVLSFLLLGFSKKKGTPGALYFFVVAAGMVFCVAIVLLVTSGLGESAAAFFQKSSTFSGREVIWSRSLDAISRHPLFGVGVDDSAVTVQLIGHTHCHNIVVQVLYSGGLAAFLFLIVALISCRPLSGRRGKALRLERSFCVVCAGILAFFVTAGLDWLYSNPLPLVLFLLAHNSQPYEARSPLGGPGRAKTGFSPMHKVEPNKGKGYV